MIYSINWPNFIAWLTLRLEILGNMCIVIICCPLCNAINFEINLSFFVKPSSYMTKKAMTKIKYLKTELVWNKKYFSWFLKLSLKQMGAISFQNDRFWHLDKDNSFKISTLPHRITKIFPKCQLVLKLIKTWKPSEFFICWLSPVTFTI